MPISISNFLKNYQNRIFVETGSYQGNTIQLALDCGFEEVRSVELNESNYNRCVERFKNYTNVKLYFGESEVLFSEMIKDITEPITFWLDSHYSGCGDTYVTSKGRSFSSIVSELQTIKNHPIKNHTILIDDIRDAGTQNFDYVSLQELIRLIKEINPKYDVSYATGSINHAIFVNDILVARI